MFASPPRFGRATLARLALVLSIVASAASCSAVLKWDPNNLPCDTQQRDGNTYFCRQGYSCQVPPLRCVRDASLGNGHACSQARQCKASLVCPIDLLGGGGTQGMGGVQECLGSCTDTGVDGGFLQVEACTNQGEVCLPYLDAAASTATKSLLGGCFPSAACTAGASCALNGVAEEGTCVQMSQNNVTACLQGCEISWSTTQQFSDNCDANHGCVPVGMLGNQAFSCLYNAQNSSTQPVAAVAGQSPRAAGAACSPVLAPCGKGYVCSQGICAEYCQMTTNQTFPCPTGQSCCPFKGFATSQPTGFSSAACN